MLKRVAVANNGWGDQEIATPGCARSAAVKRRGIGRNAGGQGRGQEADRADARRLKAGAHDWPAISCSQALLALQRLRELDVVEPKGFQSALIELLSHIAPDDAKAQGIAGPVVALEGSPANAKDATPPKGKDWDAQGISNSLGALGALLARDKAFAATKIAKDAARKLIELMHSSLQKEPLTWLRINHTQALLGMQRLREANAIEPGEFHPELVELLSHIAPDDAKAPGFVDPLDALRRPQASRKDPNGDDWNAQGISNCLGALGALLANDKVLAATKVAKTLARKLIKLMDESLRTKPAVWIPINYTQALLGLRGLQEVAVIKREEVPRKLSQLLEGNAAGDSTAAAGKALADAIPTAAALHKLGEKLADEVSEATSEDKKEARELIERMAQSLRGAARAWSPLRCSEALLGLQRLREANAIRPGEFRLELVELLNRVKATGKNWSVQQIGNSLGALGALLAGDEKLAETQAAKDAAEKLIELMHTSLATESHNWLAIDCTQALLGLQRLRKAKTIEPGGFKSRIVALLNRVAAPGNDWSVRQIANSLGALGALLAGDKELAQTQAAKDAAEKLLVPMRNSFKTEPQGWTPISCSQALLGIQRLRRAEVIELGGVRAELVELLNRVAATVGRWEARQIANSVWTLGALLASDGKLAATPAAQKAAAKLIQLMDDSLRSESDSWIPMNYTQALLGLQGIHDANVIERRVLAGEGGKASTELSISGAVALVLERIAALEPRSFNAAGLLFLWPAVASVPEHGNARAAQEAMRALTAAAFGGALDAASDWDINTLLPLLGRLLDAGMPAQAMWKGEAQKFLARLKNAPPADPQAAANCLTLLRFALDRKLLDGSQDVKDGWTHYGQLWQACTKAAPTSLALTARLLNEGNYIHRDWQRHWPKAKSGDAAAQQQAAKDKTRPEAAASPLGERAAWRDHLVKLALGSEGLIDSATLKERHELRHLCTALDGLNRGKDENASTLQKLSEHAVSRLNDLLEPQLQKLETVDQFPFTALELTLVRKYLRRQNDNGEWVPLMHTPPVKLLSQEECDRILGETYERLGGEPKLITPQLSDKALGVAHVNTAGRPLRMRHEGKAKDGTATEGKEVVRPLGSEHVDSVMWFAVSAFKALFGDRVPPPVMVHMRRGDRPADLPAFIKHDGLWYRTDLFQGSANRGDEESEPRMIAIAMEAAPLFDKWLTSDEARIYMQRLHLFTKPFAPLEKLLAPFIDGNWQDMLLDDEARDEFAVKVLGMQPGELLMLEEGRKELDEFALHPAELEYLFGIGDDEADPPIDDADVPADEQLEEERLAAASPQAAAEASAPSSPNVLLEPYLNAPLSDVPRVLLGEFDVCYVADSKAAELFRIKPEENEPTYGYEHLRVQDGCGFIHEDLYLKLIAEPIKGLPGRITKMSRTPATLMFPSTALHHYDFDPGRDVDVDTVYQLVAQAKHHLNGKRLNKQDDLSHEISERRGNRFDSPLFRMMATGKPITYFGTAVPVKGDKLRLPDTPFWRNFRDNSCPILLGRAPFDTRRLQVLTRDDIELIPALDGIAVQYSLDGLVQMQSWEEQFSRAQARHQELLGAKQQGSWTEEEAKEQGRLEQELRELLHERLQAHGAKGLLSQVVPAKLWPAGDSAGDRGVFQGPEGLQRVHQQRSQGHLAKGRSPLFEHKDESIESSEEDEHEEDEHEEDEHEEDDPLSQQGIRHVKLHGVLGLKEQRGNLIGVPEKYMELLAGDWDGDLVLLTVARELPALVELIRNQGSRMNSKLLKSFTRALERGGAINPDKVVQLMTGQLVEDAGTLSLRFGGLPPHALGVAWDYLLNEAESVDKMLDRSLYRVLYQGQSLADMEKATGDKVNFKLLARETGVEPQDFKFDVHNLRQPGGAARDEEKRSTKPKKPRKPRRVKTRQGRPSRRSPTSIPTTRSMCASS